MVRIFSLIKSYYVLLFDQRSYDSYVLQEEQWAFRTLPKKGHELTPHDFLRIEKIIKETTHSEELSKNRAVAKEESW